MEFRGRDLRHSGHNPDGRVHILAPSQDVLRGPSCRARPGQGGPPHHDGAAPLSRRPLYRHRNLPRPVLQVPLPLRHGAAAGRPLRMSSVAIPSYFVWMVFIAPFIGALIAPLTGRSRLRDYIAVAFSLASALFALALLLPILQGQTLSVYKSLIPASLPWIPELGINVGVLSDPYTVIIANLVAWISFL